MPPSQLDFADYVWHPFAPSRDTAHAQSITRLALTDAIHSLPLAPQLASLQLQRAESSGAVTGHAELIVASAWTAEWSHSAADGPTFADQPRAVRPWDGKGAKHGTTAKAVAPTLARSAQPAQRTVAADLQRALQPLTQSTAPIIDVAITLVDISAAGSAPTTASPPSSFSALSRASLLSEFSALSESEYRALVSERAPVARVAEDEIDRDAIKDWRQTQQPSSASLLSKENKHESIDTDTDTVTNGTDAGVGTDSLDQLLLTDSDSWLAAMKASAAAAAPSKPRSWAVLERLDVSAFADLVPSPALRWPFELDTFQKEAIVHLERGSSVFVAAHTSAGKTVVAEYAIAMAQRQLTRCIYTSPIKTLSNQKFREFRSKFGASEVGLITGDVSIQPEAPCLIMTTEILRSMLYKGADLLRELNFVIFDEIHYINDSERGVVWEESLVMLPSHTQIVLLSATVPNVSEFAAWVGRIKQKPIYVISTDKRPVPLQHALYCKGKFYPFLDSGGKFNGLALKQARDEGLSDKKKALAAKGINTRPRSLKPPWHALIRMLQSQSLLPVVIFCFSKQLVESSAHALSKLDLTSHSEKSQILVFFAQTLARLSPSDRRLPQCLHVKEMARRGIGVHHAGMLPILKESVEILYGRGLLRVLFATETFAMGVNMPCRTVAFHSLRKHDGTEFRSLHPGEYTQMAGRAGRRGLDPYGLVLVVAADPESLPDEALLRTIATGKPQKLESKFRLTYSMILNLLRQEELRVEDMMRASFAESSQQRQHAERARLLEEGERALARVRHEADSEAQSCHHCQSAQLAEFGAQFNELEALQTALIRAAMQSSTVTARVFRSGRVLVVSKFDAPPTVAVVVKVSQTGALTQFAALLLLPASHDSEALRASIQASSDFHSTGSFRSGRHWVVLRTLRPRDITAVSELVVEVDPTAVMVDRHQSKIDVLCQQLQDIEGRHRIDQCVSGLLISPIDPQSLPVLKLMADVRVNVMDYEAVKLTSMIDRRDELIATLSSQTSVLSCSRLSHHLYAMSKSLALSEQVSRIRATLDDSNLQLMADYEAKLRVLRQLRYINDNRTVQLKGRVACELNSCDALIGAELIFENCLADLTAEETLATLSCLVFQERHAERPQLEGRLELGIERLQSVIAAVCAVQQRCGVELGKDADEWCAAQCNTGLAEVVHAWARGVPFVDICALTNVLEGSIVRSINRLDETCKDLRNAARVIGDRAMHEKMSHASTLIRRDIVFAASLYLT